MEQRKPRTNNGERKPRRNGQRRAPRREEKEFEDMTLRFVPSNANGNFTKTEVNVIYSYSNDPDPLKSVMVVVYIAAGLILAGCVASTLYTNIKRKKAFAESMDIDE